MSTDVNALKTPPRESGTGADVPCRIATRLTCGRWTNPVFDE